MNGFYTRYYKRTANQSFDWTSDDVRVLLLRSTGTYAFNPDHEFVASLFSNGGVEITVASYAREAISGQTLNVDDTNNLLVGDCDNISFGSLEVGQTVSAFVFYQHVTNDADSLLIAYFDGKENITAAAPAAASTSGFITGATQANPCVITSAGHGLSNGDQVYIASVGGMTALNNRAFTVAGVTSTTFQLSGENSSAYSAWTSGGTWNLVRKVYVDPLLEAVPESSAISFNGGVTGTVVGSPARGARVLGLRSLSGTVAEGTVAPDSPTTMNLPVALGGGAFSINIPANGLFDFANR